jgi:predicted porin
MQKKIIALAVAGLVSGAAYAQTNVTVYGVVDAAFTYSKQGDNKFTGIESGGRNGSRVGFRGEEALGNGLKGIFTLEFGTEADTNTSLNATRLAFVGLSGKFGSVTLGRQGAPSYIYWGATSANDVTSVNPVNLALGNWFDTFETGGGARWDNSVAYSSPNFSGLDFRVIYSFGEKVGKTEKYYADGTIGTTKADVADGGKFGLGVRYANGPLYLTAIYQAVQDNDSGYISHPGFSDHDTGRIAGNKAWGFGGSYDFKVAKIYASYVREKDDDARSLGVGRITEPGDPSNVLYDPEKADLKKTLWSIGVGVPVSKAGTITAEYMQFKGKVNADLGSTSGKAKGYGIGYEHKLSNRTIIYGALSRIDNDDGISWGFGKTAGGNFKGLGADAAAAVSALYSGNPFSYNSDSYLGAAGEKSTNLQVGIRHAF